ncbi:hypothetical protein PG996_015374 [Apiospora saccharicola]|uniref:UDENN FLCN/SMCR8-type domain-containing protein n=1 Tax=Apiospora saccharicola TaxID=335842 RepID=A0ABR1TKX6_9PEZI
MVVTHRPPTSDPLLTSHIQLCLAHYCDLHGPTPLMVTEGLPVPCSHCYDDRLDQGRPQTSAAAPSQPNNLTDAMRKMQLSTSRSSSLPASEQEAQVHRAAVRRTTSKLSTSKQAVSATSAIETPPQSPRKAPEAPSSHDAHSRTDPNFRRTYDPDVTKNASPCQNCALTLPKRQESNGTRDQDKKGGSQTEPRGPTLRTRTPYARVYGGSSRDASPPNSNPQSSCASDDEDVEASPTDTTSRPPATFRRPVTSASQSSVSSKSSLQSHTHYLDYTSTHEPQIANTYSIVRASCLRTLSFETLPRRPEHASNYSTSTGNPAANPMPSATHSSFASSSSAALSHHNAPASQSSGGPIFFGDPLAGYTTAFIFRIPDRHARGRRRVYAFLALSTHRERVAMKAFNFLSVKFQELADWIVRLAEIEAEREREREEENSPITSLQSQYTNGAYGGGGGRSNGNAPGPRDSGIGLGGGSFDREKPDRDSGSSFLTGGSRSGFIQRMGSMGGSMGPGGFAPKARGLAELVGLPDFFIELHAKFVTLLLELSVVMGS